MNDASALDVDMHDLVAVAQAGAPLLQRGATHHRVRPTLVERNALHVLVCDDAAI